jgi:Uma2 family endonuclease
MIATLDPPVQGSDLRSVIDDENALYEIIDGQRVELAPMSILASQVASEIQIELGHYVKRNRLGRVVTETLFKLPLPMDRNRRLDVAFVSTATLAQAPQQEGSENAWEVMPDLMVEVISPNDNGEDIIDRVNEYFEAGTKLVWVVYPTSRLIFVFDSPRHNCILGVTDELDGGIVLPDFRIPIASLFPA